MTWKRVPYIYEDDGLGLERPEVEAAIKKAVAARGKWSGADIEHLRKPRTILAQWEGVDSIWNLASINRWPSLLIPGIGGIVLYSIMAAFAGNSRTDSGMMSIFTVLVLLPSIGALLWGLMKGGKWINQSWTLTAKADTLTYNGGTSWTVPIAAIARVETSATADWEAARSYGMSQLAVPKEEVQTFLFMADGSRRVIYTVHGGRELAATLAHSIRSWLDEQRAARTPPAVARGGSEGFTL